MGGATIAKLPKDSKTAKLGFQQDDMVLELATKEIKTVKMFAVFMRKNYKPGQICTATVLRDQKEISFSFEDKYSPKQ